MQKGSSTLRASSVQDKIVHILADADASNAGPTKHPREETVEKVHRERAPRRQAAPCLVGLADSPIHQNSTPGSIHI
eukprot:2371893-Amphidinium_carterae.1